jgi:hypothetical protein
MQPCRTPRRTQPSEDRFIGALQLRKGRRHTSVMDGQHDATAPHLIRLGVVRAPGRAQVAQGLVPHSSILIVISGGYLCLIGHIVLI